MKWIKYILVFMFSIFTFPYYAYNYWRKDDKSVKTYLIVSGIGLAFSILGLFTDNDTSLSEKPTEVAEEVQPEENTSETEVVEEPEEDDDTEAGDDTAGEPEETEEVVFEYDDNGIAIIKDNVKPGFSIGGVAKNFSYDHIKTLRDNNEKFENGIIFLNYNETQDKYGNAELTNTIATYYSRDTLDKIQWDNWYQNNIHDELLYQTADAVFIHRIILDEVPEYEKFTGSDENTPDSYYTYLGSSIDEDELNFD